MTTIIHPTAIVDPNAQIGENVQIGAYAIVEADTVIGDGTVLKSHAIIRRFTTLGANNTVDSFSVLGGEPQDTKFNSDDETFLIIGDNNTFREGVTISRATGIGNATTVGSGTYWMANAHAGHNCTIKDDVTLVNYACVAGHGEVGERVLLSGYVGVHQFCWVGEGAMGQGKSIITTHLPPFCLATQMNTVCGLNVIGMRRAGYSAEDRTEVKEAFKILFRSGLSQQDALTQLESKTWGPAATRFCEFVRRVVEAKGPFRRGLPRYGSHR